MTFQVEGLDPYPLWGSAHVSNLRSLRVVNNAHLAFVVDSFLYISFFYLFSNISVMIFFVKMDPLWKY